MEVAGLCGAILLVFYEGSCCYNLETKSIPKQRRPFDQAGEFDSQCLSYAGAPGLYVRQPRPCKQFLQSA